MNSLLAMALYQLSFVDHMNAIAQMTTRHQQCQMSVSENECEGANDTVLYLWSE
jgi:hypothetical protein